MPLRPWSGHNWLAGQLRKLGIDYRMADNAFTHIADWQRAQRISNAWKAKRIHERLNDPARLCCPVYKDSPPDITGVEDQCPSPASPRPLDEAPA